MTAFISTGGHAEGHVGVRSVATSFLFLFMNAFNAILWRAGGVGTTDSKQGLQTCICEYMSGITFTTIRREEGDAR
jgi:hypothetical protein